jgi:hypothetical protein
MRPSIRRFMKSGMRAICSGIVRPTSTIPYTRPRPAKRIRPRPYPASAEIATVTTIETTET